MREDDPRQRTVLQPLSILRWAVGAILLLLLIQRLAAQMSVRYSLDDAYMFVRYADNLIKEGCLCWNRAGPPTYGLTSVAYLLIVAPVRLLMPGSPCEAVVVSSAIGGLMLLGALGVLLWKHTAAPPQARGLVALFVLGTLCLRSYPLALHMSTGMDTTFAAAMLTLLFLAHKQLEQRRSRGLLAGVGLATGLMFLVRPDLLIFSWGVPAVAAAMARDRQQRRDMLLVLAVGAAVLGLELLGAYLYFGLPLPLPFYAKSLGSYTGQIVDMYRDTGRVYLVRFLRWYWHLFLVIGAGLVPLLRRRGLHALSPVELGVLASTGVFIVYYLFFVMQIMPYGARFYFPCMPGLLFLAARSLALLFEREGVPSRWLWRTHSALAGLVAGRRRRIVALMVAVVAASAGYAGRRIAQVAKSTIEHRAAGAYEMSARYVNWTMGWYRLDELARLPDDLVMATTEVGAPAAFSPNRTIIDMAGLNDNEIVRRGFSPEVLFSLYNPDVIYMPHPHYSDMVNAILNDRRFKERYELFPDTRLKTLMGLAIRRDSRHYAAMRAIALKGPVEPRAGPERATK